MAGVSEGGESPFLSQLESARIELRDKFFRAHKLLQEREETMLRQLQEIENSFRKECLLRAGRRKELLATKEKLQSSLKGNTDVLQLMLAPLNAKV